MHLGKTNLQNYTGKPIKQCTLFLYEFNMKNEIIYYISQVYSQNLLTSFFLTCIPLENFFLFCKMHSLCWKISNGGILTRNFHFHLFVNARAEKLYRNNFKQKNSKR